MEAHQDGPLELAFEDQKNGGPQIAIQNQDGEAEDEGTNSAGAHQKNEAGAAHQASQKTADGQQRTSKGQIQPTLPEIGEISSLQRQSSNQATNLNEWLDTQDNRRVLNSGSGEIMKMAERERTSQDETAFDSKLRLDSKSDFARSAQGSKVRPFSS